MNGSEKEENPVMRADEVWPLLKISKNTLYEWCRLGLIPHKRIRKVILFSRPRIREWIDNSIDKEKGDEF